MLTNEELILMYSAIFPFITGVLYQPLAEYCRCYLEQILIEALMVLRPILERYECIIFLYGLVDDTVDESSVLFIELSQHLFIAVIVPLYHFFIFHQIVPLSVYFTIPPYK